MASTRATTPATPQSRASQGNRTPSAATSPASGLRLVPPTLVVLVVDRLVRTTGLDHDVALQELADVIPETLYEELAGVFGVPCESETGGAAPTHIAPALLVVIVDRLARRAGLSHSDAIAELRDVCPELLEDLSAVFGQPSPANRCRATLHSPPTPSPSMKLRKLKQPREPNADPLVKSEKQVERVDETSVRRSSPFENPQGDDVPPNSASSSERHSKAAGVEEEEGENVVTEEEPFEQEHADERWPAWAAELQAKSSDAELKRKAEAGQWLFSACFEHASARSQGQLLPTNAPIAGKQPEFNQCRDCDTSDLLEEIEPPLQSSTMKVGLDSNLQYLDSGECIHPESELDFLQLPNAAQHHKAARQVLAHASGASRGVDRSEDARARPQGPAVDFSKGISRGNLSGKLVTQPSSGANSAMPSQTGSATKLGGRAAEGAGQVQRRARDGRSPESVASWVRALPAAHLPDAERETLASAILEQGINVSLFTTLAAQPAELSKLGVLSPAQAMKIRRAWEQVLREDECRQVATENLARASDQKAVKLVV